MVIYWQLTVSDVLEPSWHLWVTGPFVNFERLVLLLTSFVVLLEGLLLLLRDICLDGLRLKNLRLGLSGGCVWLRLRAVEVRIWVENLRLVEQIVKGLILCKACGLQRI